MAKSMTWRCDGCDKTASPPSTDKTPYGWSEVCVRVWEIGQQKDRLEKTFQLCSTCSTSVAVRANPENWERFRDPANG